MPSNVAGYLDPALSPAPLYDDALEDFLHDIFAALSGLAAALVRPRWQPEPPNLPTFGSNWLAFGVQDLDPDTFASVIHDVDGLGTDELQRHETIEVLLSAYGENASGILARVRDGFQIEQNRAALTAAGMGYLDNGRMIPAPTLVKDRWQRRFDLPVRFRREIVRRYEVRTLVAAKGTLYTEGSKLLTTSIDVTGP